MSHQLTSRALVLKNGPSYQYDILVESPNANLYLSHKLKANLPSTLRNGLVSYWPLDESSGTRYDIVSTNHLADNDTVGSGSGVPSNSTASAVFVKANTEWLSVDDNAALSSGDRDFTWCAWVELQVLTNADRIMGKRLSSAGNHEWWLQINDVGGSIFRFRIRYSQDGTVVFGLTNTSIALAIDTPYFVAFWHDSVADTLNLQINNGTVASVSLSGGLYDGTAPFEIGRAAATYSDSMVDEVSLHSRVLTTAEKTALYNSGNGLAVKGYEHRLASISDIEFALR